MTQQKQRSSATLLTTSLLAGLIGLTTIGCTNPNSSQTPQSRNAPTTAAPVQTAPVNSRENSAPIESPRTSIPVQSNDPVSPIAPASEVAAAPAEKSPDVVAAVPNVATDRPSESRSQAVERLTTWFLNAVNPELNGRELTAADRGYLSDREAIKIAVEREMLNEQLNCGGDQFWDLREHGPGAGNSKSLDRIAETIWASRDPVGANSRADVTREKRQALRASITREPACF